MEAQTGGSGPWLTVVGSTMIDQIAYAARMPERGETVIGDRFAQGFGGKGANQAVMARLMGAQVAMVNGVGEDSYGEQTIANFARYGIDTAHVLRFPGSSGVAPIWVEPDGSNRIIVVPGANDGLLPEQAAAAVLAQERLEAVIAQFEIGQTVTTAAFRAARERGATTILNPAPGAAIEPELAAVSDWIVPNETEFAIIARAAGLPHDAADPSALAAVAAGLGTRLLVTLGERGAALVGESGDVRHRPGAARGGRGHDRRGRCVRGRLRLRARLRLGRGRRCAAGVCHRGRVGAAPGNAVLVPRSGALPSHRRRGARGWLRTVR